MQESLGGNAKTTLVVCVAGVADHADEWVTHAPWLTRLPPAAPLCGLPAEALLSAGGLLRLPPPWPRPAHTRSVVQDAPVAPVRQPRDVREEQASGAMDY